MKALTASAFRQNLKRYLDAVANEDEVVIIPRGGDDGKGVAVISLERYGEMDETDYLLSTRANRTSLERSLAQAKAGEKIEVHFDEAGNLVRRVDTGAVPS